MKRILFIISISLLVHLNVASQIMDTIKMKNSLNEVVTALKEHSFEKFKQTLFEKENYLELANNAGGKSTISFSELDEIFHTLNVQIEECFLKIIKKGEEKGLVWADVAFEGYVFSSEELTIGNVTKAEGFLVDSHIRLSYRNEIFTLIGIQLWLFNNEYKVKGDELRGLFEIDLNTYVPSDDLYLDELEKNGH